MASIIFSLPDSGIYLIEEGGHLFKGGGAN